MIVGFMVGLVGVAVNGVSTDPGTELVTMIIAQALGFLIAVSYTVFFIGKFGATPGKMVLGLKVVRSDGGRVTYLRAFARYFAEFLSAITLLIGYIIAAFDSEKRALHDHICDTRVIKQ